MRESTARERTAGERAAGWALAPAPLRCWLLGSEALLAECGDILLRSEHAIHGVVTSAPRVVEWAQARGLEVLDASSAYAERLAQRPFDYLFAITHLALLPESILRLPLRGAINFHDGPLPDYAGLNAPAWAIWNGETSYGVAWHLMTPAIDAGPVLAHAHFDIASDETAYSLNAKCFEAAIESFEQLLPELAAQTCRAVPQDLAKRRYFERHRRPPAAGAIDWSRSARQIAASVRALDFGRHANALGVPTLERAGQLVVVRRARELAPHEIARIAQVAAPEPGTVLECLAGSVVVACGEGAIELDEFSDARGRPLSAVQVARRLELTPGIALVPLPAAHAERLGALDRKRCASESYWVRRLGELDPIELPLAMPVRAPGAGARPAEAFVTVPPALAQRFPGHAGAELVLAAWCGYLARIGRRDAFDIAFTDVELRRECDGLEAWFCARLPLRVEVDVERDFAALLERVLSGLAELRRHGPWMQTLPARAPALEALRRADEDEVLSVGFEARAEFSEPSLLPGVDWTLEVRASAGQPIQCRCVYDRLRIGAAQVRSILAGFAALLQAIASRPELPLFSHPVVSPEEHERQLVDWNRTELPLRRQACVHELFEEQVRRTPDATALVCDETELDYAELDRRADLLARELSALGVRPDALVGVYVERSVEMVVAILGVLKAGGAYLPLDPTLPAERLAFTIADAKLAVIVTSDRLARALPVETTHTLRIDTDWPRIAARAAETATLDAAARPAPHNLAYAIYTSGTTGRPKGVLIEHRNVASFFAAMDRRVPHEPPGTWLALTSLSFDISVLELLWTLARGFKVILHTGRERARSRAAAPARPLDFSLFFFSSDAGSDTSAGYGLLLEAARFADAGEFAAIWTPERHFHEFGGLFPNPAVTSAALAAITRRVAIRAGSVVLPLHHPIRVAEEWALVDNLSNGRIGLSFASGWHPRDFVLAPEHRARAKEQMFRDIETVRRLWRGEAVAFPDADGAAQEVRTFPRPVQPELPIWITSAGNVETYAAAGASGANLLTHLLGQSIEELEGKLRAYRDARARAGLDPAGGTVTLMVHTFVGLRDAQVRELVGPPLERYLESSLSLLGKNMSSFPAFRRAADGAAADDTTPAELGPHERAALVAHARERYYEQSGMFGTPERCAEFARRLRRSGVDEIACLIDFGVRAEEVLASLPLLALVRELAQQSAANEAPALEPSLPEQLLREAVTHLQCTPSMARILCSSPEGKQALGKLRHVFVGGEALPVDLARELVAAVGGTVTNMYGPTETTIWSTTHELEAFVSSDASRATETGSMPIGKPIANTYVYVLGARGEPLPIGVTGELYIGGDGVARGYLDRPELQAERFVADPFARRADARMYKTGDLVRYRSDGVLEFLGRNDHQIKIRGHRVEPGEIEALLVRGSQGAGDVAEAVVVAREDTPGDQRLVAYVVPRGAALDATRLRERLRLELPESMVPAHYVFLERIPRTHNGKIDRKALPAPDATQRARAPARQPSSALEGRLVELWRTALGVESVGVNDNFFDLGGHSLLVVRIHRQLRELGYTQVALTDLFRHPTIRSLAQALESDVDRGTLEAARSRGLLRRRVLQSRRPHEVRAAGADQFHSPQVPPWKP